MVAILWGSDVPSLEILAGLLALLMVLVTAIVTLVKRIVFPTIVAFPWDDIDDGAESTTGSEVSASKSAFSSWMMCRKRKKDQKKVVVLAGSFNPIHRGHVSMVAYLARRYGRVIVAIGMNPDKVYPVTPHQRAALIQKVVEHELTASVRSKVLVQVIPGYIWRTVQREGARVLYRGIRTWDMDGPDERKLQILNTWGPLVLGPLWWPLPTVFLQGDPQYAHISSTLIREVCSSNPSINIRAQLQVESKLQSLVPSCIVQDVMQLYGDDNSKRND